MTTINKLHDSYEPRAQLDMLPDKFLARVAKIEEKEDARYPGYKALYMDFVIEDPTAIKEADGDRFTQKMRADHVDKLLIPAMEECGIDDTDDLIGKPYVYEKRYTPFEGSYPRWVPTAPNKKGKKGKKRTA